MNRMVNTNFSLGIATKLVVLFAIFGIVPMAAVGYLGFSATGEMETAAGLRVQAMAETIGDKIDRNLFERYGDPQSFGLNRIVGERYHWYSKENNAIASAMNQYVATSGIYYLTILVDPVGDVMAVNSKDAKGNPIDTTAIYSKRYSDATWFKAMEAKEFTTKQPFTVPGNDTATGTFIEDVHVDEDVKSVYSGDDGLTLGFSAPVYVDGDLIGYWSNRVKFSLVEEIVQTAYQELKGAGWAGSEISLLGDKGQVLVDYDPSNQGTEDMTHDFEKRLFKLNLAETGVESAQFAIAGKTGYQLALHDGKNIWQMDGYTHLKGALGYPGMNWSVLVRVPKAEAMAAAIAFNRNLTMTAIICLVLILVVGLWVGRKGAQQVNVIQEAADKMAGGDYAVRVKTQSKDEIGQLAGAFNTMAEQIEGNIAQGREFQGKMEAVSKAQAVIEFNLDGTIITANDNFCHTLGYRLAELKGQHHRLFVDPVEANGPAYQAFWAKLNRGEFDAGIYRRVGKGGKEVWIQASYNPILDAKGKPWKVVKFATDITGQKKAQNEVERLIEAAAKGQLQERIDAEQFQGASKDLVVNFNSLLNAVEAPLQEARTVLSALAEGDLSQPMVGQYEGQFDEIKVSLNTAIENLTGIVDAVRDGAAQVSTASEEITRGNEDLSQRTSAQAGALEETSASMEEMTSTIKQNADNAKQANQLAVAAREVAEKGGVVTEKAVDAMSEINKSSKKIADIINVIDEIAFQTNLLALNAAVEAARAGEQGRGFAVVASEVRNLAQRSATAAKEIKALINESVQKVGDGSELVNQSGQTLAEIVNSVKRVTDIIAEISAASQEQAAGIDQVNKAVMQMDQGTQQNAALVEEATSASQSMRQQAVELTKQVSFFKVGMEPQARGTQRSSTKASQGRAVAPKPVVQAPAKPKPVLVGSSNGHTSSKGSGDDFFEEF